MAASRKKTLFIAWYRAAAARSSSESVFGIRGGHLIRASDRGLRRGCFHCAVRLRLRKRQCVRRFQEIVEAGPARWKGARSIAHESDRPRHVKGCPDRDSITEMLGEDAGIVCEVIGEIPVRPAAPILEGLGKIPVVHGAPWADAGFKQSIDEAAIVIDPFHVRGAGSDRLNARPRNGKTVALLVEASWPMRCPADRGGTDRRQRPRSRHPLLSRAYE